MTQKTDIRPPLASRCKYKRVLLKLSGEALAGEDKFGITPSVLEQYASEIKEVCELGLELAIVIGGGNIFRGLAASTQGMDRASADYMGMLATVINAMALQDAFENAGISTRVLSAIDIKEVCEPYLRRKAIRHMEKGRVVIFAAGTGNPYFTTDTAAALRAMEIQAEVICKATRVDGVYDSDPLEKPDSKKYDTLTYIEVLRKNLRVLDSTAISLCMDNKLPIVVFNLNVPGNIMKAVTGETIGTLVSADG